MRHPPVALRTAGTRCPHCRIEVQGHIMIAFHPRLEAHMPAGRRRPPQPAQMPLTLPGPESAHRTGGLERPRPRSGQWQGALGTRPQSLKRPRNPRPPVQLFGPRAITPSQRTVPTVAPAKPGSDSEPLPEHSQPLLQRSPRTLQPSLEQDNNDSRRRRCAGGRSNEIHHHPPARPPGRHTHTISATAGRGRSDGAARTG